MQQERRNPSEPIGDPRSDERNFVLRSLDSQLDISRRTLTSREESLRLKPNDANALDSRGFVKLRLGDFNGAIADYNLALRLNPGQAESLYGRGLAKIRKGDKVDGNADVSAAKAIQSDVAGEFARYSVMNGRK